MLTSEIIELFETYLDDTTELSSSEELALANRIYKDICRKRPWEFLKVPATGTLSISVPYVALPADFMYVAENHNFTDNSYETEDNQAGKVVFVGTNYQPYRVINYSDRRQYRDIDGYCYIDFANSRLVFTKQPTTASSYEFDYIKTPTDLTLATSPVFPSDFHPMIAFGMATDGFTIQLFDKARSYAVENQIKYEQYMRDLAYYNSQLQNN